MKIREVKMIDVQEWDHLVRETYGRPYSFQQQDGCQERGIVSLTVPDQDCDEDMADSVPEEVNGEEMGVKFAVWLARSPKKKMKGQKHAYELDLWWERNFYPDVQAVANDLHAKGLLLAGEYTIHIDW
jgi:hypothetical protein